MNFSSKKLFCLMVAAILSCFTITHVSADQADQLNFKLTFTPSLSTTSSPKIYATISAICTDKNNNYYPQIEQNWYDEKVLIKRSNAQRLCTDSPEGKNFTLTGYQLFVTAYRESKSSPPISIINRAWCNVNLAEDVTFNLTISTEKNNTGVTCNQ